MPITVIPAPAGKSPADAFMEAFMAGMERRREDRRFAAAQEQAAKAHAVAVSSVLGDLYKSDPELATSMLTNPAVRQNFTKMGVDIDALAPVDVDSASGAFRLRSGTFREMTEADKLTRRSAVAGTRTTEATADEAETKAKQAEFDFGVSVHKTVREFTASSKNRPFHKGAPMSPAETFGFLNMTAKNGGDYIAGAKAAGLDPDQITYSPERLAEAQDWTNTLVSLGYSPERADEIMRNMVVMFPYDMERLGRDNLLLLGELYEAQRDMMRAQATKAKRELDSPTQDPLTRNQQANLLNDFEEARSEVYGTLSRIASISGYAVDGNGDLVTKKPWAFFGLSGGGGTVERTLKSTSAKVQDRPSLTLNQIAGLVDPYSLPGQAYLAKHGIRVPSDPDDPANMRATLAAVSKELGVDLLSRNAQMEYASSVTPSGETAIDTLNNGEEIAAFFLKNRMRLTRGRFSGFQEGAVLPEMSELLDKTPGEGEVIPEMRPENRLGRPGYTQQPPPPTSQGAPGALPSSDTPGLDPGAAAALKMIEGFTTDVQKQREELKRMREELKNSQPSAR